MEKIISAFRKMFLPAQLLRDPWRTLPGDSEELLEFVQGYETACKDVKHIRILLHGPIGAGKSSFINSVDSVLQGRICARAPEDGMSSQSYTKKYKTYEISKGKRKLYPFVFNDTMGLEKDVEKGILVEDIKLVMGGHVEENYEFKTKKSVRETDGYRHKPTLQDKVHVLVFVVPSDKIDIMDDAQWRKMREVKLAAGEMGIPMIAIITKVDQCPGVGDKIENVHRSMNLKEQVNQVHNRLGVQENCIFLVKNYQSEIQLNDPTNHLILTALRQMIHFGGDFVNDMHDDQMKEAKTFKEF